MEDSVEIPKHCIYVIFRWSSEILNCVLFHGACVGWPIHNISVSYTRNIPNSLLPTLNTVMFWGPFLHKSQPHLGIKTTSLKRTQQELGDPGQLSTTWILNATNSKVLSSTSVKMGSTNSCVSTVTTGEYSSNLKSLVICTLVGSFPHPRPLGIYTRNVLYKIGQEVDILSAKFLTNKSLLMFLGKQFIALIRSLCCEPLPNKQWAMQ